MVSWNKRATLLRNAKTEPASQDEVYTLMRQGRALMSHRTNARYLSAMQQCCSLFNSTRACFLAADNQLTVANVYRQVRNAMRSSDARGCGMAQP